MKGSFGLNINHSEISTGILFCRFVDWNVVGRKLAVAWQELDGVDSLNSWNEHTIDKK